MPFSMSLLGRLLPLALGAFAGAGCRSSWSAEDVKEFRTICAQGSGDPICECFLRELPPLMPFAEYKEFSRASRFEPGAKLDDRTTAKMAHAAVVCTTGGK